MIVDETVGPFLIHNNQPIEIYIPLNYNFYVDCGSAKSFRKRHLTTTIEGPLVPLSNSGKKQGSAFR